MKLAKKSRIGLAVASLMIVSVGVDGVVGSGFADASPATLSLTSVEARLHRLSNDADQYRFVAPATDPVADWSDWVGDGGEAQIAHGRRGGQNPPTPTAVDTSNQSVIGLAPYTATSITEGEPFLLAKFTHYNNPIIDIGSEKHSKTTAEIKIEGQTFSLPADLWETPNTADCPDGLVDPVRGCRDEFKFESSPNLGEITLNGWRYKLVRDGFRNSDSGVCPAEPSGDLVDTFVTNEKEETTGCLYTRLERLIRLTVTVKTQLPNGDPVPANMANTAFDLSSNSQDPDSGWPGAGFSLKADQTEAHDISSFEKLDIAQQLPADGPWQLTKLECVDETGDPVNADGSGNGATINDEQLGVNNVVELPTTPREIHCTYTNVYDNGSRGYAVAKTADPATASKVVPGDVVTYTVTVTPAAGGARDVVVHDDLSRVLDKAELVAGSLNPSVGTAKVSGTKLTWNVGDIAGYQAGGQPSPVTLTYQVKVDAGTWTKQLHNSVTAESPDPCLGDCAPSTDHGIPGYRLTKTSDPASGSTVKPGDVITYTLRVRNASTVDLADATVTDDLSKVLNVADWVGFVGDSQGAVRAGNSLTWKLASVPVGSAQELRYQVKAHANYDAGSIANLAAAGEKGECEPQGCATDHKLAPLHPKMPDTGADSGQDGAALLWLPLVALAFALRKRR